MDAAVKLIKRSQFEAAQGCSVYLRFQVVIVSWMGAMLMQSTGQGATHNSQPVHSEARMVCICFAAPAMASTGQAWMHNVQPMHVFSSIKATAFGLTTVLPPNRLNCTPSK